MKDLPESLQNVDWEKTSWEGARREQLRRWAQLPLDRIIASLEEMAELAPRVGGEAPESAPRAGESPRSGT